MQPSRGEVVRLHSWIKVGGRGLTNKLNKSVFITSVRVMVNLR